MPPGNRASDREFTIQIQGVIMTATGNPHNPRRQTLPPPTPPPAPRRRRVLLAVGLVLLATVALIAWLLTMSSETQTRPVAPASAAVLPQQVEPAGVRPARVRTRATSSRQTRTSCSARTAPALCVRRRPLSSPGYVQFCLSSPTLCTVSKSN